MIKMRKKISGLIDRLVPISEFNKGQTSKIFERLQTDRSLVIIKNNAPVGGLLSVEEYGELIGNAEHTEQQ
jgi:PHD/YefM family antitoxin component YafN of YafNO toxin-antitoxin module